MTLGGGVEQGWAAGTVCPPISSTDIGPRAPCPGCPRCLNARTAGVGDFYPWLFSTGFAPMAVLAVTDDRGELLRLLPFISADLDRRGYAYAGAVRQAARLLTGLRAGEPAVRGEAGCVGCGCVVLQQPTGRRRKWCGEACRSRARRR